MLANLVKFIISLVAVDSNNMRIKQYEIILMQYKNLRKEYQNIDAFYCMQEKNER